MNDIIIPEITISQRDLLNAVLLYLACLGVVVIVSKYRKRLKTALWRKETILWVLAAISIGVFLPAIWAVVEIVTGRGGVLDNEPVRYMILIATITGPPFIIWRTYVAYSPPKTVEQDSIRERIATALEQLEIDAGSTKDDKSAPDRNLKVRLSAIYSLERIAQESVDDHIKIMDVLCEYIRHNSKANTASLRPKESSADIASWKRNVPSVGIDIQAAIDVIARRGEEQLFKEIADKYKLDLRECNLQRVNFRNGKFDFAIMDKSHLDFAQLNDTEMNGVILNWATLDGAMLAGARLNGAELNGAKLNKANLDHAELNGAKCNGAELNGAKVSRAKLNGAVLVGAELKAANLNGAELNRAVANGAYFNGANLNGSSLRQAVLNRTMFIGAELNGAEMHRASLSRAVLAGAELNGAKIDGTDFVGAQTKSVAVKSTNLENATHLFAEQIKSMFGDKSTTLPTNAKYPETWPDEDLDYSDFYIRWQAAKKEAGLP